MNSEKPDEGQEDHSEVVYADSKSHSFRFEANPDDDIKGSSELAKDFIPTYEMNISAEDRTDPLYGVAHESDSSSKEESMRRREMKRMQKYGVNEFSMPKVMNYNHTMYNEPFPFFCSECYYKVDTSHVSWICRGHCGKVYHDRCKRIFDQNNKNSNSSLSNDHRDWICWMCREGKAECFICKKVDLVKPNPKKPLPRYINSEANNSASSYSQSQFSGQKDSNSERFKSADLYEHIGQDESWKIKIKSEDDKPIEESEKSNPKEENKNTEFKFEFDAQPQFEKPMVRILLANAL